MAHHNITTKEHDAPKCIHCRSPFAPRYSPDREGFYCSERCLCAAEALRKCGTCGGLRDEMTFQPHKGHREPAVLMCERCAATCDECGVEQVDVELLDASGVCRECELLTRLVLAVEAHPGDDNLTKALELFRDIKPEDPKARLDSLPPVLFGGAS